MLHALAYLGVLLLSLTGASFLVMAVVLLGEATRPGVEERTAELLFGMFCLIAGFSMATTAIAVLRCLQ